MSAVSFVLFLEVGLRVALRRSEVVADRPTNTLVRPPGGEALSYSFVERAKRPALGPPGPCNIPSFNIKF
jgi:hypothetical protein